MSSTPAASLLLDLPPFPPERVAGLADRLAALLATRNDLLIVQAEAVVALEATAASLARPGLRALNIVTSPYGDWFGQWLRRGGAGVDDLGAGGGLPVSLEAVEAALSAARYDLVALVHAESASGILNPLPGIAASARAHGALVVVDAVASVGGHDLDVDALGIDIAVIGPQKALGGSAGLSALSVSPAAWDRIARPGAPERSALSLLDLRKSWLDTGRGALPGMPSALELHALDAALGRVEAEGLPRLVARHHRAARAARAGLSALGLAAFVPEAAASNLVTAARLPAGLDREAVLARLARHGRLIGPAIGPGTERLLRLNHTGPRARFDTVLADIAALAAALADLGVPADPGAATRAVLAAWAEAGP